MRTTILFSILLDYKFCQNWQVGGLIVVCFQVDDEELSQFTGIWIDQMYNLIVRHRIPAKKSSLTYLKILLLETQ